MADPALEQIEDRQAKAHSARPSSFWGPERETRSITPSKIGSTKYYVLSITVGTLRESASLHDKSHLVSLLGAGGNLRFPHISVFQRSLSLGRELEVRSWAGSGLSGFR